MNWLLIGIIVLVIIIIIILYNSSAREVITSYVQSPQFRGLSLHFYDNVIKPAIISKCKSMNPALTQIQLDKLGKSLTKAYHAYINGKPIKPIMRSIIALVVPMGSYAFDLVDTFCDWFVKQNKKDELAQSGAARMPVISHQQLASISTNHFGDMLINNFGCNINLINKIPTEKHKAIWHALSSNDPFCGIAIESILNNGKIVSKVSTIITQINGSYHAHLYKTDELMQWLNIRHVNPHNGLKISDRDVYQLS